MVLDEIVAVDAPIPTLRTPDREKWEREQRAFFRMLGDLLRTHNGQYVAIHDGVVVAAGTDLVQVATSAYAKCGRQPIYVDLVTDHPLPTERVPHYRLSAGHA